MSAVHSEWHSETALALWRSVGGQNPKEGVVIRARQLIKDAGISGPPFDPQLLARYQGVREIRRVDMTFDACLIPEGDGYIIEVSARQSTGRQNFSCAHEVAHTFLMESDPSARARKADSDVGAYRRDQEEEHLCDVAAAELLMPIDIFRRLAYKSGPSPQAILDLAKTFDVSVSAAAVRWIEAGLWKAMIAIWKPAKNNRPESGFKLDWSTATRGVRSRLDRGVALPFESVVGEAYRRGKARGKQELPFGPETDCYDMHCIRLGSDDYGYVLCMVLFEASYILRASELSASEVKAQERLL